MGRRSLKGIRYNRTLEFDVTEEDIDGNTCERLNVQARTLLGEMTKLAIWADGVAWVYFANHSKKGAPSEVFEKHANLAGMDPEEVADLLRATLRDLETTKHIWQRLVIPSEKA